MTTHLCSTAAEVRTAIEGGAVDGDTIILTAAGTYSFSATLTAANHGVRMYAYGNNTVISSTADPILTIDKNRWSVEDIEFLGEGISGGTSQRGIGSDAGLNCRVFRCKFSGLEKGMKLDLTAANWSIEKNSFFILGTAASYGYGILVGVTGGHSIFGNTFLAAASTGRHGVYLSGGTSNCEVHNNTFRGFNESSIAQYSLDGQPTCKNNHIYSNVIETQAAGASGTGGIEVSGIVTDSKIIGNRIVGVGRNGIVINTLGLVSDCRHLIEDNRLHNCGEHGILLQGAPGNTVQNNSISLCNANAASFNCIQLVAWYQSSPTMASSNNIIRRNRMSLGAAAHYVFENQTAPIPANNTISDNVQIP